MRAHEATQRYKHWTVDDLRAAVDSLRDPQERQQILERMAVAGYHNDHQAFLRLYRENRLSYTAAQSAWYEGIGARQKGMKCSCAACKNRPTY
jgi:hypothetical protein